jgi:hypothetical protein
MNSVKSLFLISLSLSAAVLLGACRSDRVTVDRKDPRSPQFAYRLDELAMLQMAVDDIQGMEQDKHYGQIYDDFASPEFKQGTSRRRFLIWGNCAETYLGGLEEYDRNELGFFREQFKKQAPIDSIARTVHRSRYLAKERMGFVYDGIHFKLRNWTWITNDKPFLQCMEESAALEKSGQVVEEPTEKTSADKENGVNNAPTPSSESSDDSHLPSKSDSHSASSDSSSEKTASEGSKTESSHSERDSEDDTDGVKDSNQSPSEETPPVAPTSLHYARAKTVRPSSSHRSIKTVQKAEMTSQEEEPTHNSPPVPGQH